MIQQISTTKIFFEEEFFFQNLKNFKNENLFKKFHPFRLRLSKYGYLVLEILILQH